MNAKIAITRCDSYEPQQVQQAVVGSLTLLGGISAFVAPKAKVLVKPNILMAKEPEFGVTTHPEVVRAVIKSLKGIECKILVGDGPSVWGKHAENVDEVYKKTGIEKMCREEEVELVRFEKNRWRKDFSLTNWLDECAYTVNVPKFKTHEFTTLTAAIKNLYGLVSAFHKPELHKKYFEQERFANIVVDLLELVKPSLTIVDGVIAMEGDGPATSGILRHAGVIVTGADCVAIDSILAVIMGLNPSDILITKVAAGRGLGVADLENIEVAGERLAEVIGRPFKLPASFKEKMPQPIIEFARALIRFYPKVQHLSCVNCGSCIEACPHQLISRKRGKITIDYSRCISCFCCQESCPASAIKVKKSFFARLVGL